MRRAAVSVPANVAEGQSTGKNGRYRFHVHVALGSLGELATHVEIARRLNDVSPEVTRDIDEQLARTGQRLHGLARSIKKRQIFTASVCLALLAGPGLVCLGLPIPGLGALLAGMNDILALPLAAFYLVPSWIHVYVLAHRASTHNANKFVARFAAPRTRTKSGIADREPRAADDIIDSPADELPRQAQSRTT